jgi:hypothetical protein
LENRGLYVDAARKDAKIYHKLDRVPKDYLINSIMPTVTCNGFKTSDFPFTFTINSGYPENDIGRQNIDTLQQLSHLRGWLYPSYQANGSEHQTVSLENSRLDQS